MASVVARALVAIDADKASKQDLELLKKLVMEFKDELDALGVKVDKLDKRVAVLEDGIGGWKIRGIFRFDAKFANDTDNGEYYYNESGKKNDFEKERFRLFLTKQIDENTYFYAQYRTGSDGAGNSDGRGDLQHMRWSHLFVNTKLPYNIDFRVGRFAVDFEDDYGLYTDNDAIFGDFRTDGFRLSKKWNTFKATAIVGRNDNFGDDYVDLKARQGEGSHMSYVLDLNWQPNEKFMLGATGYWFTDDSTEGTGDYKINNYGIYAGYKITPAVELKGIYYFQDLGDNVPVYTKTGYNATTEKYSHMSAGATENSPKAWKAILDIKQDLLKFTGLWIEYSQQDNTYIGLTNRYSIGGGAYDYVGRNMAYADPFGTSKWWFVKADQKWNDKWSSFIRFANVDYDTAGLDDATEWGLGVGYQYTPAIYFELAYDQVDHGDNGYTGYNNDLARGKDHVVRFRTNVSF
ncbi:S-layer homology domain-containing protein [Cloacibacillus evryensis]|uniref:S-layer homology domain-containing protein n=1 Tax=Cloacibacillus evryensis TaxID=508460 RepID=UPI00370D22E6